MNIAFFTSAKAPLCELMSTIRGSTGTGSYRRCLQSGLALKSSQFYKLQYMRVNRIFVRDSPNVTQYAYIEQKNQSYRHQMEDNYVAEDNIVENKAGFFAILDGHGGADVSEYCSKYLPEIFKEEYQKEPNSIKTLFTTICRRVDREVESINAADRGTTCCLVLVERRGHRRYCCIGNLGDTRAVICTDKQIAKRVSIDHKVNNPSQVDRIKSEGGTILKGRVAGTLAITRALGDLDIKPYGVSNIPDYQQFEIDQKVRYMIVASDGLWDVCEDQQAIQLCKGCPTSKDMSKKLVSHAISNGSKDNISILVLKF